MKTKELILKNFLVNSDNTGRFIVKSLKTGISYFVEPISKARGKLWGDVDVANKKLRGDYGNKFKGSIEACDSLIHSHYDFLNISVIGGSPFSEIERRDEQYLRRHLQR